MEGETEEFNFSLFFHFFHIRNDPQVQNVLPFFLIQAVKQIEVHVIHFQTVKLFLENPFCVIQGFHVPYRQLGCQIETFTVIFFQDPAHKWFTVPVVVRIGGIYVCDSGLQCTVQHALGFSLVDISVCCLRKAHTSKAQKGWGYTQILKFTVFHCVKTSSISVKII